MSASSFAATQSIPQYIPGAAYHGGDQVQNIGKVYECKPWPCGESLFLRKLVLGIPAQASSKNLTRGDANAKIFSTPIENIEELIVPSITITEVFKFVLRQRGEDMALEVIAHMEQGKVVSLDSSLAAFVLFVPKLCP
jgi:hypothetical protein